MIADDLKKRAYRLIILFGLVSLFADVTYEGARSIISPYLKDLGASAVIVGVVIGLGEFLGYALRIFFGYFADKTRSYWFFTILGYSFIFSIPLIYFFDELWVICVLIILERCGKAIRNPARDAILSNATKQTGRGKGFGLHEALDQLGAIIGPFIFMSAFLHTKSYREGFSFLWIPAVIVLLILLFAKIKTPTPEEFEKTTKVPMQNSFRTESSRKKIFFYYLIFTLISVIGFANFQMISFHLNVKQVVSGEYIPIIYSIAMGVDALVAIFIGRIYDKIGIVSLAVIPILSVPIPFLGFSQSFTLVVIAIIIWGAVMGIQETIMRAAVADITPIHKRGVSYGMFNTIYGVACFLGSVVIGYLYDKASIDSIIIFVVVMEIISVIPLIIMMRASKIKETARSSTG